MTGLRAFLKSRGGWPGQIWMLVWASMGGAVLAHFGVPGGWLSGAMIAIALLATGDLGAPFSPIIRRVALTSTGVAVGSAVTPQMMKGFGAYPLSIIIMMCGVGCVIYASARVLERARGWDQMTALLASIPGALSYVFALAGTLKADMPRIAIVQVSRVFFLMALVPILVTEFSGPLALPPQGIVDSLPILMAIFALSFAVGYGAERLGLAAGSLLGSMAVSALFHATGFAPGRLPLGLIIGGQVLLGAWVGSRFLGFDWKLLRASLVLSLGSFAIGMVISTAFAGLTTYALGIPFAETMIAFAPGGLEAMTVLAFALGLDPLYVSAHHLARFILISLALPFIVRIWQSASGRAP